MRKPVFLLLCLILVFSNLILSASIAQEKLDLTLDKCVEMTLRNNEQILGAEQQIAEADGALRAANSDKYLQVNFTSWYQRSKDESDFETKDYNATLRADQRLLRFGEVPGRLDAAQEQYRQAQLALESAKINAVDHTRRIFYDIILIQDEMRERKALRNEIEKKRARTEERVQKKIALELDLLDVELELARQDLRLNELKRDLRVKSAELLQAIGADEEAEISISGELADTEFVVEDCISKAMKNRVELKDTRGLIERQARILGESVWEILPEFRSLYRYKDLSLVLDQEGKTWDTLLSYEKAVLSKENGQTPEKGEWEFSLGLAFPLFDGFRVKGIVQEERARLEKLKIELLQMEKRVRLEVKNAYQEVDNEKENMDILNKVVTLRRKTLERMEAIMETPVISEKYPRLAGITFEDVIRAREQYTEAQRDYFAQKRNYMLARENLRRIMGIID